MSEPIAPLKKRAQCLLHAGNFAHDLEYVDKVSQTSLAARVCANDEGLLISTSQAEVADAIEKYLDQSIGPCLQALCVLAWLIVVIKVHMRMCTYASVHICNAWHACTYLHACRM